MICPVCREVLLNPSWCMLWGWANVFCLISAEGENFHNILIILNLSQPLLLKAPTSGDQWTLFSWIYHWVLPETYWTLENGVYNHWWSVDLSWQNKPLDDLTPKVLFPPVFNQLHMVHMSKTKNCYGSFQTDHHTKSYKVICKDQIYASFQIISTKK